MYSESAKFEFNKTLPQSARLRFLGEMAAALESAVSPDRGFDSPGFSIELDKNGDAKITIWHPWKRDVMWSQLVAGHRSEAISVTHPKNFSGMFEIGEP